VLSSKAFWIGGGVGEGGEMGSSTGPSERVVAAVGGGGVPPRGKVDWVMLAGYVIGKARGEDCYSTGPF